MSKHTGLFHHWEFFPAQQEVNPNEPHDASTGEIDMAPDAEIQAPNTHYDLEVEFTPDTSQTSDEPAIANDAPDAGRLAPLLVDNTASSEDSVDLSAENINGTFIKAAISPVGLELDCHVRLFTRAICGFNNTENEPAKRQRINRLVDSLARHVSQEYLKMEKKAVQEIIKKHEKNKDNWFNKSTQKSNTKALNKELKEIRAQLSKKYQLMAISTATSLELTTSLEDIPTLLESTVAFAGEAKITQNKQTHTLSGTTGTAHNKGIGNDAAAVKVTRELPNSSPNGVSKKESFVRVPSLAPLNDDGEVIGDGNLTEDIKKKITGIRNDFFDGTQKDITYNLLTFNRAGLLFDQNAQEASAAAIQKAIHQLNSEKVKGNSQSGHNPTSLIQLLNISNNTWGPSGYSLLISETANESFAMAEMAIMNVLHDYVGNLHNLDLNLATTLKKPREQYIEFLKKDINKNPYLYKDENFRNAIKDARNQLKGLEQPDDDAPTQELMTRALAKLVADNQHLKAKNGGLVQGLCCALEENKMIGCKSANERTALLEADKNILLSGEANKLLKQYINGKIKPTALYSNLQRKISLKTAALCTTMKIVSYRDQGADSKLAPRKNIFDHFNTNKVLQWFMYLPGASEMQAHKVAKKERTKEAFLAKVLQWLMCLPVASKMQARKVAKNERTKKRFFVRDKPGRIEKYLKAHKALLKKVANTAVTIVVGDTASSTSSDHDEITVQKAIENIEAEIKNVTDASKKRHAIAKLFHHPEAEKLKILRKLQNHATRIQIQTDEGKAPTTLANEQSELSIRDLRVIAKDDTMKACYKKLHIAIKNSQPALEKSSVATANP